MFFTDNATVQRLNRESIWMKGFVKAGHVVNVVCGLTRPQGPGLDFESVCFDVLVSWGYETVAREVDLPNQ